MNISTNGVLRSRWRRWALARASIVVLAIWPLASRADTVASLLGNFTINQYCGLRIEDASVRVHYTVVFGQLPALRELHLADANSDGVTSQIERDAYVQRLAPEFARSIRITVDGVNLPLRLTRWTSSLPTEQGGFSLRLDADFSAPLAATNGVSRLQLDNLNYSGSIGWREIALQSVVGIAIFDSNGFGDSLTEDLNEAIASLPASGPLAETSVHLSFVHGAPPPGSVALALRRGGTVTTQSRSQPATAGEAQGLQAQTQRLVALISAPTLKPGVAMLALLTALALGALHALSPGHGKTIVGAYLVGSKGTPKHAWFLGLTVTLTHTLGVFALGFATLFASRYFVPQRLFPILSLLSGILVLGMGMILLAQRWRAARTAAPGHDHTHEHGHDHGYAHDHGHAHEAGLTHSHGGSSHTHAVPGADGAAVTWRSLLALGISGGLIPCPSAMVLLLAAVALNKTAFGLLLVVAFSIGLALTLSVIGLLFLYARSRMSTSLGASRWFSLLPVLSAAAITVVGAILCVGALQAVAL